MGGRWCVDGWILRWDGDQPGVADRNPRKREIYIRAQKKAWSEIGLLFISFCFWPPWILAMPWTPTTLNATGLHISSLQTTFPSTTNKVAQNVPLQTQPQTQTRRHYLSTSPPWPWPPPQTSLLPIHHHQPLQEPRLYLQSLRLVPPPILSNSNNSIFTTITIFRVPSNSTLPRQTALTNLLLLPLLSHSHHPPQVLAMTQDGLPLPLGHRLRLVLPAELLPHHQPPILSSLVNGASQGPSTPLLRLQTLLPQLPQPQLQTELPLLPGMVSQ